MLCTAELDMAKSGTPNDGDVFLNDAAWAIALPDQFSCQIQKFLV
jgi:hypothetical protein